MLQETNEFKLDLLITLNAVLKALDSPDKLIIHTSQGTILGNFLDEEFYISDDSKEEDSDKIICKHDIFKMVHKLFKEKLEEKEKKQRFPKGVWLKNVEIFLPGQTNSTDVSQYFLFLDQVVGVTVGSIKFE